MQVAVRDAVGTAGTIDTVEALSKWRTSILSGLVVKVN